MTRCAVAVANWILRTFAPEYSRVLNNMCRREMERAFREAEES
ncbi:hypothetical protein SEA_DUPLICITY_54 [Mycobacterium phage Duplicity]|uniref:Uncharacterized protein n=1 Tax=Mycobacterium phage Duplicity TaxID=2912655 RepID=A0AA49BQ23_9CAUD|nr:hypothetical protein SEA_DUPLICITY_54 [Mycobacterium phage Duplicity]